MKIKQNLMKTLDSFYYSIKVTRKKLKSANYKYNLLTKNFKITHISDHERKRIQTRWRGVNVNCKWFDLYYTFCNKYRKDCHDDISLFIPLDFFVCRCEPFFNHPIDGISYSDKNMNDMHFSEIKQPKTVLRYTEGLFFAPDYTLITREDARVLLNERECGVIKPATDSGGGQGIVFFDSQNKYDFDSVFSGTKNLIVQEFFQQHQSLKRLHESSVNTVRVLSLVWEGQVVILSSVVRMGMNNKQVDNLSVGGMYCGIDNEGRLAKNAFANYKGAMDSVYTKHPNSGVVFEDYVIPNFDRILDAVKQAAPKFCRIGKMIAWDFSIDEVGDPVMIETNMCGVDNLYFQMANGPIFGDLTDQIIEAVKSNPRKTFGIK